MKKIVLLAAVILGIIILSFSTVAPALAAELDRSGPGNGGGGAGGSTGGGSGHQGTTGTGTGVPVNDNINLDGVLSDLIHANLATALGIIPEELAARLDAGETLTQIALSLGFDSATISDILTQARADALAQAIASGLITQEQADWLASRGNQTPAASYGDGICDGTGDCVPDGTYQSAMMKNGHGKGFAK
ncbi:MAG: hypothetical protein KJ638_13960 [Chloroflexi bacterium]|nr:hypothetical protein [Chloroflexota bacterium]